MAESRTCTTIRLLSFLCIVITWLSRRAVTRRIGVISLLCPDMNPENLKLLIRALSPNASADIRISFATLIERHPKITVEEVAEIIGKLPGVKFEDSSLKSLSIPAEYFQA